MPKKYLELKAYKKSFDALVEYLVDHLTEDYKNFSETLHLIILETGFPLNMKTLLQNILTEKQKELLVDLDKGTELILQKQMNGLAPFISMKNSE